MCVWRGRECGREGLGIKIPPDIGHQREGVGVMLWRRLMSWWIK